MIASLRGKVTAIRDDSLVVDVGGVGYQIHAAGSLLEQVTHLGQALELYTHMCVRENDIALYGFHSLEEQDLFAKLIEVSGIGPRTALAVLSSFSPEALRSAIARGDAMALTRVPGIGRKTAQRLMLDLKDRIGVPAETWPDFYLREGDADVIDALTALGYSLTEARGALAAIERASDGARDVAEGRKLDERILAALRFLGSG